MQAKLKIYGNSKQVLRLKIYESFKSSFSRCCHFMSLSGFMLRVIIQISLALETTHTPRTTDLLKNAQIFGGTIWEGGTGCFMYSQTNEVDHQGACHFLLLTEFVSFLWASPLLPGIFFLLQSIFFLLWPSVTSCIWDTGILVCMWA